MRLIGLVVGAAEAGEGGKLGGLRKEEERFLTSAGRRIRRSECGRKSRSAPFEMTGWRGGPCKGKRAAA